MIDLIKQSTKTFNFSRKILIRKEMKHRIW